MADDISLVIGVESKEVSRAVDELIRMGKASNNTGKAFEQGFKKVVSWLEKFAAQQGKVNSVLESGYLAQQKANKSAKESASVFGELFKKQEKFSMEQSKVNAALEKNYIAQQKANKSAKESASVFEVLFRNQEKFSLEQSKVNSALEKSHLAQQKANKSARESANVFKLQADEIEKLSMKYKPLYASSKLYETKLQDINRAQKLGVLSDKQREASLEKLNMEFKTGTGTFATYANGMGKGANRLGVAMQQTGYQVGDFLVQVQSGQNPMVAFGQQATQLVGIMYLLPQATLAARHAIMGLNISLAGITLGLSILIPLLSAAGAYFMRSKEAAKEASSGLEDYGNGLENIINKTKELREQRLTLTTSFDSDVLKASEKRIQLANRIAELDVASVGLKGEQLEGNKLLVQTLEKMLEEETKILSAARSAAKEEQDRLNLLEEKKEEIKRKDLANQELIDRARETSEAERILGEQMLSLERDKALAQFNLDLEATNKTIEAMFQNRTLYYSIRFSGDSTVMGQSLTPAGPMKPSQSYEELLGMGWAPEDLKRIGMDAPKGSSRSAGGGGGGKSQADELSEYLQKKQEEAYLQSQLVGLFGTEREIQSELLKARKDYFGVLTPLQDKELENTLRQTAATKEQQAVLEEAKAQQEGLAQSIANSMGDAFMSVIDGTASVKDAFKSMASAIIKELLQVLVIQRLVGSVGGGGVAGTGIAGFLSRTLASANGNVFSGGSHVQAYANGGVVGGPTYFPMSGGKTGLMGEAGPEAIMPLKRGANGKLGVQMEGGGGDNVVINQSFNFQANGDDSVKKLIAQAAPKIAQMTKSSMLDDRRRGGQTKSVFG